VDSVHRNRIADLQLRGNTRPLAVRVYWPSQPTSDLAPLLVFCMAGAGAEASCQSLSSEAGLVVLSVDCIADADVADPHDGTAVLEWAAEHAAELGADPGRLLVAGQEAGAAVAAAVALKAGEQGWPVLTQLLLINPGSIPRSVVARLRRAGITVDEQHCIGPGDESARRVTSDPRRTN
jgi:acetyl esterase